MNGYLSQSRQIEITEDGENTFEFDLVRNAGSLSLEVTPTDAVVMLNRQQIVHERRQELAPGMYRVEISNEGYESITDDIQIERGINKERIYNLEAHTGRLEFSVNPNNASTTLLDINGTEIDSWSGLKMLDDVKVGSYTIQVAAEGYRGTELQIQVLRDELLPISIILVEGSNGVVDIDGNEYEIVQIGNQFWMAENLKTTKYRDGSLITNLINSSYWLDTKQGAWVNYNNSDYYDEEFGKLYNWYAVKDSKKLCPTGWHIPTTDEWASLFSYISDRNELNDIGFNIIYSGERDFNFKGQHTIGIWWTSTEDQLVNSQALSWEFRLIRNEPANLYRSKSNGFSVRCIRD